MKKRQLREAVVMFYLIHITLLIGMAFAIYMVLPVFGYDINFWVALAIAWFIKACIGLARSNT